MTTRAGVALLGATGSIGRSATAVLERHRDRFRTVAVTAHRNAGELARVATRLDASLTVLAAGELPTSSGTAWHGGREALLEAATHPDVDIVINALVGAAGLEPTLAALRAGKRVALANKESLVCAGELVRQAMREGGGEIVPVDSEHSAILQCLGARSVSQVSRLILTASG